MKRKRVILHIGAPKTGSTYLQAFLSRHAGRLRTAGVDYPCAEAESVIRAGASVGNVLRILQLRGCMRQDSGTAKAPPPAALWNASCTLAIVSAVRTSASATVLLSSEVMAYLPSATLEDLHERLSVDCAPEFILFVRDPYDWCYSSWRQRVKNSRFAGTFEDFISEKIRQPHETRFSLEMFRAAEMLFGLNAKYTLINYDTFRNDLGNAFLKGAGIDAAVGQLHNDGMRPIYNRSLSPSEALLLNRVNIIFDGTHFPAFVRHLMLGRVGYVPCSAHYYNRNIDAVILDAYRRGCIENINKVILGDPLRTSVREESTGEAVIEEQDIAILIEALQTVAAQMSRPVPLFKKLLHTVMVTALKNIPRDFDPEAYLLMNKDVAATGINPYLHYARHGLFEGRPYRYY